MMRTGRKESKAEEEKIKRGNTDNVKKKRNCVRDEKICGSEKKY